MNKSKYKKTFWEDWSSPLCQVERDWLRRTGLISIMIPLFILMPIAAIIDGIPFKEAFGHIRALVNDVWPSKKTCNFSNPHD